MRELTEHQVNQCNQGIAIQVMDDPTYGGACHLYHLIGPDGVIFAELSFQRGPINEAGINGITQEALLAVILDRLRGFQSSTFKCRENAIAITKLEEAVMWLHKRTKQRQACGVEGTNQV